MYTTSPPRPHPHPRGFLLVELLVATLLIGTIIAGIVPVVRGLGQQRRLVAQQGVALAEATALLQQARGQGRASLPTELAPDIRNVLPEARLAVETPTLSPDETRPAGEWLRVTIEWTPTVGSKPHRVTQAAWIAAKEGA
jgi:type II secretory pathway pseudopilin PulG